MVRTLRRFSLIALCLGLFLPTLTTAIVHAATVAVTTTADVIHSPGCATDGATLPCSLRDAVLYANAHSGAVINLPAGAYTLTIPPDATDDATTGDLNVTADMTINGVGAATTIIQASATNSTAGIDRVIRVAGVTATINDVTVRNGRGSTNLPGGGGIFIAASGVVFLNKSVVAGNTFASVPDHYGAGGGGIYNDGTLTVNDTIVSGNTATGVPAKGGGISQGAAGGLTINNSTISGNVTTAANENGSYGGGIYSAGGQVAITNTTVSGNNAGDAGGGIFGNGANMTVMGSTVSGNGVTSERNNGSGGGMYYMGGSPNTAVTIVNSTFSGNTSLRVGGAILNFNGRIGIDASTIVNNTSGVYFTGDSTDYFYFRNSLFANNATNCAFNTHGAPFLSADYNLSSDTSCTALTQPHDLNGVNPLVGPLANNGGPTQTHALLSGSPALDRIPMAGTFCPTTDQRGVTRPQGSLCDIGAYELSVAPAPPSRPGPSPDPSGPPPAAPPKRPGPPPLATSTPIRPPTHR